VSGEAAAELELSASNAAAYLRGRGIEARRVTELGGGVSNVVLLVESDRGRFVMKQALGKLRVEMEWLSDRRRILREAAAVRLLSKALPAGSVPSVVFVDEGNLLFAMTAAPEGSEPWKDRLLRGEIEEETARKSGAMLAAVASYSWQDAASEAAFGDQTVFYELRLDPYYRTTAARHPDLAPRLEALLEWTASRRHCLVHGDWSPKNLLVLGGSVFAIDFEVIHYGDPSFDAAFLLNHLVLKSFYRPRSADGYGHLARAFWNAYAAGLPAGCEWMEQAVIEHLACLLLARIDGKSPAEYIRAEGLRARVRQFARKLIVSTPGSIEELFKAVSTAAG